jgi:hypothetical protein
MPAEREKPISAKGEKEMTTTHLRIAISGTYSTGKTTTTEALSIATGIPRTDALTARQITLDLFPGKRFQDLTASNLLALGLRRLEERIQSEAVQQSGYISDGSVLHEWIYGQARLRVGINPGAPPLTRARTGISGIPAKPFLRQYLSAYGHVVKARARQQYDAFVHLPLESTMDPDGHRPVSEKYRRVSDEMLRAAPAELGITCHVVGGSVRDRLARIIDIFGLPVEVDVDEAIALAGERLRRGREALAERQLASLPARSTRKARISGRPPNRPSFL